MEQERNIEAGSGSFFGEYIYDQVEPKGHFLRKLREVVDWGYFTKQLIKLYKGQGVVGRPPFDMALVLKVEVIAYLYKLSERQVEVFRSSTVYTALLMSTRTRIKSGKKEKAKGRMIQMHNGG